LIFARFDKQDEFNERQEKFNSYVVSRLDKIEADIKKMDTTQPIWFTQWVESDFDPLKHRIDNIVRLNNLKE
jgi:hypothetical protein